MWYCFILSLPHTFMQCEVIKARLCESLFSQRPYLAALPRESNDAARAQKMQTLLDWQLNERMDLPLGLRTVAAVTILPQVGITAVPPLFCCCDARQHAHALLLFHRSDPPSSLVRPPAAGRAGRTRSQRRALSLLLASHLAHAFSRSASPGLKAGRLGRHSSVAL